MALYSALHPVLEAIQWFKNGDHPDDHVINNINSGRVVGRLVHRTPEMQCKGCGNPASAHGKLLRPTPGETITTVCPGDYVQTFRDLKGRTLGHKVWKQKLFEQFFTLAKDIPND